MAHIYTVDGVDRYALTDQEMQEVINVRELLCWAKINLPEEALYGWAIDGLTQLVYRQSRPVAAFDQMRERCSRREGKAPISNSVRYCP